MAIAIIVNTKCTLMILSLMSPITLIGEMSDGDRSHCNIDPK